MSVMFFPTQYVPSKEKMRELEQIQENIYFSKVEYLFSIRRDSPSMQNARKEELHRMYRSRWEVIQGGKAEQDYSAERDAIN